MDITHVLGLLGGLALFLYGMQMMSEGLEDAAGSRMKRILEKLTSNRILGVAVGAGITAVIQSSSATTVMVVGFVNSGLMTLRQAVWIIMGANIGTTVTGQLIALDVGMLAPLFAFLGVALVVFFKSPGLRHVGKIMAGFGVLFIGMDMMGAAMDPLRDSQEFISLMTQFSNPVLGILAGAVFTAVIQSSSASVGILQTLAAAELIPFESAVFVLFGMNIGTCITAVLASIGTNRSAKQTTLIHLMFNIIGTTVFTVLCSTLPVTACVGGMTPADPAAQIANMHTIFNVVTTILLLPFGGLLASLAMKILPEKAVMEKRATALPLIEAEYARGGRRNIGAAYIHMDILRQEVERMVDLAAENVDRCFGAVLDGDPSAMTAIEETENTLDDMNKEVSQFISRAIVGNNSADIAEAMEAYFLISGNAERIGDHAHNIGGYTDVISRKSIEFSEEARAEIREMRALTSRALTALLKKDDDRAVWLSAIAAMEQQMDDMTTAYREGHLERMRQGKCSEEACILYSELLTDFERIGDHALNIAQALVGVKE